jgi:peptide/nickel transport system substrate-binding protein
VRRAELVLALVASMSAGCGAVPAIHGPAAGAPSVLRIAIGVDPDTLDPKRQTTVTVTNVVQMVVESLTSVDQEGRVQPALATSWDEAPDGLSWTFALRRGVRFSDGAPLDAAAVQASLDRALDPSGSCPLCNGLPDSVRSVDQVDASHVRLVMRVPVASDLLLGLLGNGAYGIMSPRSILMGTPSYREQEHPVGTGPYVLKEWVKGEHVTLVRNDRYWGQRPFYDEQVVDIVPEAPTREALVRSGQDQVALLPPVGDLQAMGRDGNVKVLLAAGDRAIFVALDTQDRRQPLLRNVQVRRALNYAINRDAIIQSTLFGMADPATSVMAPSDFGYCAQTPYRYDPELARSMLQSAGASGLTVSLIAPTGRYVQDFQAAQNVAGDLRAIGVNVQGPTTMDWPTYVSTIVVPPDRASVDMHLLGFAPAVLDAGNAMLQLDPNEIPPRGLETSYYDNPAVTALLTKAKVEPDREARYQEYCDAQRLVWEDAPWIFLWTEKFPIIYSSRIVNVSSNPTESFDTVQARPA